MGPNIIFDKSFLQCLNPDEAVWLDNFFFTNITPLLFIETLADLEKEVGKGRTPEQVVGNLAYKTPDRHSVANQHHNSLIVGELLHGAEIEIGLGRPIVGGGSSVQLGNEAGVVFRQSPEAEALQRWHKGEYLELERQQAKDWRRDLEAVFTDAQKKMLSSWLKEHRPSSLSELWSMLNHFLTVADQEILLLFGVSLVGLSDEATARVQQRWKSANHSDLKTFSPYFRYFLSVEIFFYLARAADLIGQRTTNKVDMAYLYYLPFCMVFASNDNLHRQVVPLFLRENQSFVWGNDLKRDLGAIDAHYDALPQDEKNRGLDSFAHIPPPDPKFLVTRLWDKHMRVDWRDLINRATIGSGYARDMSIIEKINRAREAAKSGPDASANRTANMDFVISEHMVYMTKGKWRRFAPDVERGK